MKMFRLVMVLFSIAICGFAVGCADDGAAEGGDGGAATSEAGDDAGSGDAGSGTE